MNATEMQTWLEEADPETSAFEISRESFTELVKYMQSLTAQLASAKEERDVLGQAIGEAVVKAGIANDVPMTGPELLLMLDGVVSSLAAAKEEIAAEQEKVESCRATLRGILVDREKLFDECRAAESLLSAERKETERLRELLAVVYHYNYTPYDDVPKPLRASQFYPQDGSTKVLRKAIQAILHPPKQEEQ